MVVRDAEFLQFAHECNVTASRLLLLLYVVKTCFSTTIIFRPYLLFKSSVLILLVHFYCRSSAHILHFAHTRTWLDPDAILFVAGVAMRFLRPWRFARRRAEGEKVPLGAQGAARLGHHADQVRKHLVSHFITNLQ